MTTIDTDTDTDTAPSPPTPTVSVTVCSYGNGSRPIEKGWDSARVKELIASHPSTWVDIDGIGDANLIKAVSNDFSLHPLVQEDIVRPRQRPKVEFYDEYLFVILRMCVPDDVVDTEQLALVLTPKAVVTFQETPGEGVLDELRRRTATDERTTCEKGTDRLLYLIVDAVVDGYFPVLEDIGEQLDELEMEVHSGSSTDLPIKLRTMRTNLRTIRRVVWPLRDAINTLVREHPRFISEGTRIYLRDCYDHVSRLIDLVEMHREAASDLMDLYLSVQNFRMNDTVKILTMFSAVFTPLTFIVGLYGMNFDPNASPWNMPELKAFYGYPVVLLVMGALVAGMLIFFRRKNWL